MDCNDFVVKNYDCFNVTDVSNDFSEIIYTPGTKPCVNTNPSTEVSFKCYSREPKPTLPEIKKVVFNNPATIILWNDGTKTVVKAHNEEYDHEKGFAIAIAKKALGNKGNYYETIKKWVGKNKLFPDDNSDKKI